MNKTRDGKGDIAKDTEMQRIIINSCELHTNRLENQEVNKFL
jgi:hypothetical protein